MLMRPSAAPRSSLVVEDSLHQTLAARLQFNASKLA